jgi:hypothetical protein
VFSTTEKIAFYKQLFGKIEISRNFENVVVKCPHCGTDGKRKLSIRVHDDLMHCWVCNYSARNLIPIIKKFSNADTMSFYIEKFLGRDSTSMKVKVENEQSCKLPPGFTHLGTNPNNPIAKKHFEYLQSRNVTDDDLWYFSFGFSQAQEFYNRIIIPSFDVDGVLNYWVARKSFKGYGKKYTNPPVKSSDVVFNEHNIDWDQEITIVEGVFDLIRCNENATCLLGSTLSEQSLLLTRILQHETPVLLALDKDKLKMQNKIAKCLSEYDISVRILSLGNCDDVGEMTPKKFESARESAKKWSRLFSLKTKIMQIGTSGVI